MFEVLQPFLAQLHQGGCCFENLSTVQPGAPGRKTPASFFSPSPLTHTHLGTDGKDLAEIVGEKNKIIRPFEIGEKEHFLFWKRKWGFGEKSKHNLKPFYLTPSVAKVASFPLESGCQERDLVWWPFG